MVFVFLVLTAWMSMVDTVGGLMNHNGMPAA